MNFRSVLEVVKFSTLLDVLQHQWTVSSSWQRACASDEFWWLQCAQRRISAAFYTSFATPLEAFRSVKASHFLVMLDREEMELHWYDCRRAVSERVVAFPRPEVVLVNSQFALMEDLSIVVCGGGERPSAKVVRVSRDGEVTDMPRMRSPRKQFGFLCFRARLYAFGGVNKNCEIAASESLLIATAKKWAPLGNMISTRSCFVPCGYRRRILICGGSCTQCEAYDTEERCFVPLPIELDVPLATCVFPCCDSLIILQPERTTCLSLDSLAVVEKHSHLPVAPYFAMRPVVDCPYFFALKNGAQVVDVFAVEGSRYVEARVVTYEKHVLGSRFSADNKKK